MWPAAIDFAASRCALIHASDLVVSCSWPLGCVLNDRRLLPDGSLLFRDGTWSSTRLPRSCSVIDAICSSSKTLSHLIVLTNPFKSPPSTISTSPLPTCPQPSPTSPTILAGLPATTLPGGIIIFAGTTVLGNTLHPSLIILKGPSTQFSPMWTWLEMLADEICELAPMKTLSAIRMG